MFRRAVLGLVVGFGLSLSGGSAGAAYVFGNGTLAPDPSWCGNNTLTGGAGCGTYVGQSTGNDNLANVKAVLTANSYGGLANTLQEGAKSDTPGSGLTGSGIIFEGTVGTAPNNSLDNSYFGTWASAIPIPGAISVLTVKAGSLFAVYVYQPAVLSGNYSTEAMLVGSGNVPLLSHFSAFVPLPAALPLLLSAIGGLLGLRWFRRRKVEESGATA